MTVVRDDGDFLALWFPKGTHWKAPTTPRTRPRAPTRAQRFVDSLTNGDWVYLDAEWDVWTLVLVREGDWHAVWVSWQDGWRPWGWYVNLQEPIRRTPHGVQTMDLMLDVLIGDDTWRWKDEDEFAALVPRLAHGGDGATGSRRGRARNRTRAEEATTLW
ncbi:MAG: DUF402 domain-containing protein [Actinomycetota bacterium]|nr:DUF402 domain-containing protein [Actinomycetota bacterium]